ncbi:MAG: hypothetical protein LBJ67_14350 [Planctomycetaceae bacterium]|jgi:flagellar biosynthesis/type III secretory pathway protein FliH|nr:hypothetical protein [Planctomycetaceae bacterium]
MEPHQAIYRPQPFNFVDMQAKADEYLDSVRIEAARIAESAKSEIAGLRNTVNEEIRQKKQELIDEKRQLDERETKLSDEASRLKTLRQEIESAKYNEAEERGYQEGYARGNQEGYKVGEEKALTDYDERLKQEADRITKESLKTLKPALEMAIENLKRAENVFVSRWEEGALRIVAAMARQAIRRELPNMADVPIKLLREALELAVGCTQLKIRMNPQDTEALNQEIHTLIQKILPIAETEIIADIRVTPGGCYLETSQGIIDQQIESRLERIVSELVE